MKPLLCIASPRDIPEFQEAISKIQCDKVFAKYYKEREAYQALRQFFLRRRQYTHMVICPDDLIITQQDFSTLTHDVERFDFPILAGTCKLNYYSDDYVTAKKLDPHERFTTQELFSAQPIKRVEFDGFALSFIRRDIVNQVLVDADARFDYAMAKACHDRKIAMYVDVRANMTHLANRSGIFENWGVGIKEPRIVNHRG